MPSHASKIGVFEAYDTLNINCYHRDPEKAPMVVKTRPLSYCALKASQKCDL